MNSKMNASKLQTLREQVAQKVAEKQPEPPAAHPELVRLLAKQHRVYTWSKAAVPKKERAKKKAKAKPKRVRLKKPEPEKWVTIRVCSVCGKKGCNAPDQYGSDAYWIEKRVRVS